MKRNALKLFGCLLIGTGAISVWEGVKKLRKEVHPFEPGPLHLGRRGELIVLYAQINKKEKVVYTFTWNQARKLEYELERTMDAVVNDICYDCVAKYDEIIVEID